MAQVSQILLERIMIILLTIFLACLVSPLYITNGSAWHWPLFEFAKLHIAIDFYYDRLTWLMLSLVGFMSVIIYSYSKRYLFSDRNQTRFMMQLFLLTLAVMLLMISGSLLTAFIAWQLIGLSLYLLLNHYHYDIKSNKAAKKKFMINRVGDICFLLAVVMTINHYGTTAFPVLFQQATAFDPWILLLVFVAVMTKSAQFPFHIWLIDTMEAPTPVSALMHAGVINSGGFLLARLSPMLYQAPYLLLLIFLVGLVTALLGNYYMKTQPDIKKQLAYSTVGQMGYMVMQCGLGCFSSAVFHLIAHGFFKATLFLSSGSTLSTANQTPSQNKPGRLQQWRQWTISLLITILFIGCGLWINSQEINPLLWLFIATSVFYLINAIWARFDRLLTRGLFVVLIAGLFGFYLFMLHTFDSLIDVDVANQQLITLGWVMVSVVLALMVLYKLICGCLPTTSRKKFFIKLFLTSFYKGRIELMYRRYLINPLRRLGDQLLKHRLILLVAAIWLAACMAYYLFGLHNHAPLGNATIVIVSMGFLVVLLLMANRVYALSRLFVMLILITFSLSTIAFYSGLLELELIGGYQLLNSLLVLTGFALLLRKRSSRSQQAALIHNRLPWSHFYMSVFLMLLIGIPGTASFISEFYLLSGLLQLHFLMAVLLGGSMALLALVVLHALQEHFFNPRTIAQYTLPITPGLHVVCLALIGFNIFNGIYPAALLRVFSMLLGT